MTHYRLVPGSFPDDMPFHFDGLSTVMSFHFAADGTMSRSVRHFESNLKKHWDRCIFLGTGTGPKPGLELCTKNPAVNLLPIQGQLWLTIDTAAWGRVDPANLETLAEASVKVPSLVLNAHPACDPHTKECFVQYPCHPGAGPLSRDKPWSKTACISRLVPTDGPKMETALYSNLTLPHEKIIQHSHSPCITPHYIVSKLDSFGPRLKLADTGMLKELHQIEDNLWQVMDRRTNASSLLTSNLAFVNNHFWNCFEDEAGHIVVDTIPATSNYLDTYFKSSLSKPTNWSRILLPPQRCVIRPGEAGIECGQLLREGVDGAPTYFDYPTFNPLHKMDRDYRWFYAISPTTPTTRWFDRVLKVDAKRGTVAASWSAPHIFVSEADFVPAPGGTAEDDGLLLSILYNVSSDASSMMVFNATTLQPVLQYFLPEVVPFHAHGIVCPAPGKCFTNP